MSRRWAILSGQSITVPSYLVCGGAPLLHPIMAAAGAAPAAWLLHSALWVLAPLNVVLLGLGARVHRALAPVVLGGAGSLLILVHLVGHDLLGIQLKGQAGEWGNLLLIRGGAVLLIAGSILDLMARRKLKAKLREPENVRKFWDAALREGHTSAYSGRRLLRRIPAPPRCKLCYAPFARPGGWLMLLIGRRPSRLNPNFCDSCLDRTPVGGTEIEVAILFADVRGSTSMGQQRRSEEFAKEMNRFFSLATGVLVSHDALIEKFAGDAVVAIFAPGYAGNSYVDRAIEAGVELAEAMESGSMPVGIGVHWGPAFVGLVGEEGKVTDIAVLGDTANLTSRLSSAAGAGEVVVSSQAMQQASSPPSVKESRRLELKGIESPVDASVIR